MLSRKREKSVPMARGNVARIMNIFAESGFECELALFGAAADAFSTYKRGVADADEPEETRQECFLMIHKGHRRRGGVESTAGRGDDQLLTARETLHAGRGVLERLAGHGKAINPGL